MKITLELIYIEQLKPLIIYFRWSMFFESPLRHQISSFRINRLQLSLSFVPKTCPNVADPGKDTLLTIVEIFKSVGLSPNGPVPWGTDVPEANAGVYVLARGKDPSIGCKPGDLSFVAPFPAAIDLDFEYERLRWLPDESVVYIGKTDGPLSERIAQFRRHKCGNTSPHAGGQVVKLLQCDLWIFWSRTFDRDGAEGSLSPYETEQKMLLAFKEATGQIPFANEIRSRRPRRVRRLV